VAVASRAKHAGDGDQPHGPPTILPAGVSILTAKPLNAEALRAAFEAAGSLTVGLEDELMLLEPETLDLAPLAPELLARLDGDPRFKPELPAAQLEIVVAPTERVADAVAELAESRRVLAAAADGLVRLASAGVHPCSAPEGELNRGERYDRTAERYGPIARRQLVFALQVHVAPGDADAALAVYNALRGHLPEIAALAANAPFHAGADTGLASVRPQLSELLPRQGVPPSIPSWEAYARELEWGARSGTVPEPAVWWWELRPHPGFGTLELRVPDAQTTVAEAAGVAAFVHCLVAWLAERHGSGEALPAAPSWRIAENRFSAARDGLEGTLADLTTGEPVSTRASLKDRIDELAPVAERLGCAPELQRAKRLAQENGAQRQRRVAGREGIGALPAWLAGRFLAADE